jgi:hypothetical protein
MDYTLDDMFSKDIDEIPYYTESQSKLLKEYISKFGHGLPMAYIPKRVSTEELFEKVQICIEAEKDILLKLLNVTVNPDYQY